MLWYHYEYKGRRKLKKRHLKTLESVFKTPVQSNVKWSDIEKLLEALGAELSEGSGSRVRIVLNGVRAVFHKKSFAEAP